MKKFVLATITALCASAAVLTVAHAGILPGGPPTDVFGCEGDESTYGWFCAGDDLYEVDVNCDNLADPGGAVLAVWSGSNFWDFNGGDIDDGTLCQMYGEFDNTLKTEGKCTNQENGPNKKTGKGGGQNGEHDDTAKQVDFEIKDKGQDEACGG